MSIEAMKKALEALKAADKGIIPGGIGSDERNLMKQAITALRQAIADAEKPVAWMRDDGTLLFADGNVFAVGQAFYTAPPKREWVGLTDDEIWLKTRDINRDEKGWGIKFARAIEAKLREKNT